jgi:hypothetical protein
MRRNHSVAPLILILAAGLVLPLSVAIKNLLHSPSGEHVIRPRGDPAAVVALRNGDTMLASPGTPGRQIIDWLASDVPEGRFELGGKQFVGRSVEPTLEARARVPRLIAMLRSDPSVHVDIVGHSDTSGDPAADRSLSEQRARKLADLLHAAGISSDRIRTEGRGGSEPIADETTTEGRQLDQRVSLILVRKE